MQLRRPFSVRRTGSAQPVSVRRGGAAGTRARRQAHSVGGAERGFSLIELIVVVIIIGVLSMVAIPAISARMRDNRTREAAQQVSQVFRNARMQAMGRGSAVLVRFDNTVAAGGRFEVREARRQLTTGGCTALPSSSCSGVTWLAAVGGAGADNLMTSFFEPASNGAYKNVTVDMYKPVQDAIAANQTTTQMDVCFTPMGRAYVRFDQTTAFIPLTGVITADVWRGLDTSTRVGLTRQVLMLPNGAARVADPALRAN